MSVFFCMRASVPLCGLGDIVVRVCVHALTLVTMLDWEVLFLCVCVHACMRMNVGILLYEGVGSTLWIGRYCCACMCACPNVSHRAGL